MTRFTIFLLLLSLLCLPVRAGSSSPVRAGGQAYEAELKAYVTDFLQPISKTRVYKKRLKRALGYIPVIVTHAKLQELDPLLVAVMVSFESAWDFEAVGKIGERGLMQTHRHASKGFDMQDPAQQIAAGCAHLARAVRHCKGDLPGALSRYGTGKGCRPLARFVKRRLKAYRAAVKRYRK
jgi:soluble lytic murein transglycosylase-like protein